MENQNEVGAPSMYEITKVWHEGKDKETWTEIYTKYVEEMKTSTSYMFFIDYLKEYYHAPLKK